MAYHYVDALVDYLQSLETEGNFTSSVKNQVRALKIELKFVSSFLKCMAMRLTKDRDLLDVLTRIDSLVEDAEMEFSITTKDLDHVVPDMLQRVMLTLPEIRDAFLKELDSPQSTDHYPSHEMVMDLIECLLENLRDATTYKANSISSFMTHIKALEENIRTLRSILQFTANHCIDHETWTNLLIKVDCMAQKAAQLCWVDQVDEEMAGRIGLILSDLLQKTNPVTNPEVMKICLRLLKTSESSKLEVPTKKEILVAFIGSLLKTLMELLDSPAQGSKIVPSNQLESQIEALPEELKFLRAFLEDLPKKKIKTGQIENFLIHIEAVVLKAGCVIYLFCSNRMKEEMSKEMNLGLLDLLKEIKLMKAEVRKIYLLKTEKSKSRGSNDLNVINRLLKNLKELEDKSPMPAGNQFEMLHEDFALLAFILRDIDNNQLEIEEIKELENLWIVVVDAAHEANYVAKSLVTRGGPVWNCIFHDILEEIRSLKTRATAFYEEKRQSPSSTNTSEELVVGFEDELMILMDCLIGQTTKLDIVSIVGMGGAGKTALAKRIFHDPLICNHFHSRAWCSISQIYSRRDLLLKILCYTTEFSDQISEMTDEELHLKLYKNLKGRRYFIVMDDLWDAGALDDLRFPDDHNGSRILITTRLNNLAFQFRTYRYPHLLRLFTNKESWELLQSKLFFDRSCPQELIDVGMQIAEKCGGLPLKVVDLANHLSRIERTRDSWKVFLEGMSSFKATNSREFMDILEMNYKVLPAHLKPCFLYLGAFPENEEISVRKLLRLWIAERLIVENGERSIEDEAEMCLLDLKGRSLLTVVKTRSVGRVKGFLVDNALHDFILVKAKEENFLHVIHGYNELVASPITYEQNRLCINSSREQLIHWRSCSSQIQSLLFFPTDDKHSRTPYNLSFIYDHCKLLRVLDLESINMGRSFPSGVDSLVQLRYLAVKGEMNSVPSSIVHLLNLETFLVKGLRGEIVVPNTIWEMTQLRYLHINNRVVLCLPENDPEYSFRLDNLYSLSTPFFYHGIGMQSIMSRLPNLRKLRCSFLESWDGPKKCNQFQILDFPSSLESLIASSSGNMARYPCEFNFPLSLKKLTLSNFRLPWTEISRIARLPNLEALKLRFRAFEGQRWDMEDGEFRNLKYLELETINFTSWNTSEDNFPRLEQLVLKSCKQLEEVPCTFAEICTLIMIEVKSCSPSVVYSVKSIQEEQQDMGNEDLKVLIYPPDWDSRSS